LHFSCDSFTFYFRNETTHVHVLNFKHVG
jgi:hypothetical protein